MLHILKTTLLAMMAASACASENTFNGNELRLLQGDFDWNVTPAVGFPVIGFDDSTEESEVVFKYDYTGIVTENKLFTHSLRQNDCVTPADPNVLTAVETLNPVLSELAFDVDIVQDTITNSVHYFSPNPAEATISFCMRVDYNYLNPDGVLESIMFHETNVTISVDLTAGFQLTAIDVERIGADTEDVDASLDYPVEAYFCDDANLLDNPTPLTQGSALQVCVKMDDAVTADVYVNDIQSFTVSQPLGPATDSDAIIDSVADPLTLKTCGTDGVCNVKTQLSAKFFVEDSPNDLQVDGIAILAFGSPTGSRRLSVPLRGLLKSTDAKAILGKEQEVQNERNLQATTSQFDLEVGLVGGNDSEKTEESSSPVMVIAIVTVVIIILLGGMCCCFAFFFMKKRQSNEEDEENHKNSCETDTESDIPVIRA